MTHRAFRSLAKALVLVAASAAIAGIPALSHAQNVTFADFTQQDPTQRLFSKTGNVFTATDAPVFFRFSVDNGYGPKNVFISARLNFTATFTGPITSGSGNNAVQVLQNINAVFTADLPGIDGSRNLLNVNNSTGQFNVGSQAGGENSATDGGNTLDLSSAALDFSGTSNRNMSLSFTSITPPVDSEAAVQNQNIPNFTASGGGSFASTPAPISTVVVPEPGTLSLLALCLAAPVLGMVRRRSQG